MSLEREKNKLVLEKCQNVLKELLKDEDNKYCVDCDAKSPRWASWNIGIFLCIRCAGIHRNLGVHISKVKSVNLDTWTPQQVASIQQMGNSRARAVYEANLQDNFRRPQTESSLEQFIRAKYEAKKYIAREWVPQPLPNPSWDIDIEKQLKKKKEKKSGGGGGTIENSASTKSNIIQAGYISPKPLPKAPGGGRNNSPNSSKRVQDSSSSSGNEVSLSCSNQKKDVRTCSSKNSSSSAGATTTIDLLGGLDLQVTANTVAEERDGDIFGEFLTAPPLTEQSSRLKEEARVDGNDHPPSVATQNEESNFFNQKLPPTIASEKLSKDSILALYSQTSTAGGGAGAGAAAAAAAVHPHPPQHAQLQHVYGGMYMGVPGITAPMVKNHGIGVNPLHTQNLVYHQTLGGTGSTSPYFHQGMPVANVGAPMYPGGIPGAAAAAAGASQHPPATRLPFSAANPFAQIHTQMGNLNLDGRVIPAAAVAGTPYPTPQQVMGAGPFLGNATQHPSSTNATTSLANNLWQ